MNDMPSGPAVVILPLAPPELAEELERRNAILEAVGHAATRIVAAADWRDGIQELLDRLGRAMDVSRVTLFEVHEDARGSLVETCRWDWAEPGLARLSDDPRYRDMPLDDPAGDGGLDDWTVRRQKGEVVQARRSEVTGHTRQVFEEHGTHAFLSVPVMVDGSFWGFVGFDDCRRERSWSRLETEVLRTAAALIAGAVRQAEAKARLVESEERYALAAEGASEGLFDWDVPADRCYLSPRLRDMLGLQGDVRFRDVCDSLRPACGPALWQALDEAFDRGDDRVEVECERVGGPARWFVVRGLVLDGGRGARRVVGSLRDITDRKAVERALARAEGRRAQLARYFPAPLVEAFLDADGGLDAARELEVAVLFADLFDFTATTAAMAGPDVIRLLREFHALVEEAVFDNGGTLDKYIGDGVMATFGTPAPGSRDAANAVACARSLVASVVRWNRRRRTAGLVPLPIGVGLHCGPATLGNVGSGRRLELTVIGHTVNIASRLETMTRRLPPAIVASDAVISRARAEAGQAAVAGFAELGRHRVRGHGAPLRLWGLEAATIAPEHPVPRPMPWAV